VFPDPRLPARVAAAAAVRRLSEALVGRDADDALLDEVATWAAATAERVGRGAPLERAADYLHRRYTDPPPPDGPLITSSDRPVSGPPTLRPLTSPFGDRAARRTPTSSSIDGSSRCPVGCTAA